MVEDENENLIYPIFTSSKAKNTSLFIRRYNVTEPRTGAGSRGWKPSYSLNKLKTSKSDKHR